MKLIFVFVSLSFFVAGCATPVSLTATGGSKADGVVELSYDYGNFQVPVIDEEQALSVALKRCKAWGYKNAEPFEGAVTSCASRDLLTTSCIAVRGTRTYQCLSN